ncbi:MAG: hypothetical protein ACYS0G_01075 [Planctomycetota bacterium]|jgi:tetratricopeptide (TPR) repeat protein
MDRDRLKEVHQTELTESRINEEFVDWLKTKGPSWLLVILIAVAAYLALLRWKQHKSDHFALAWSELLACRLPGSFEDVAAKYADIAGLPQIAKRQAADTLLQAVQIDRLLETEAPATEPPAGLTDEERQSYLDRADRLYREVLDLDDGTLGMTLHATSALNGRAAVAEARGDVAEARTWYEQAAARAESHYPALAARARGRAATADVYGQAVSLPTQTELPTSPDPALEPAAIEDVLREFLPSSVTGAG